MPTVDQLLPNSLLPASLMGVLLILVIVNNDVTSKKTDHYKLFIFEAGAVMAAIAAPSYASYISFVDPLAFALLELIFILFINYHWWLGRLQRGNSSCNYSRTASGASTVCWFASVYCCPDATADLRVVANSHDGLNHRVF